jgi:hypothetical protein
MSPIGGDIREHSAGDPRSSHGTARDELTLAALLLPLLGRGTVGPVNFSQIFSFRQDDEEPASEPQRSIWLGPPEHELGRAVPVGRVIARSETGVVAISHAVAYSTGIAFDFVAQARGLSHSQANLLFHEQHMFEGEELPDGLLRIGFELSDGRHVSNLEGRRTRRALMRPGSQPEGPVLMPYAGGGGSAGRGEVVMRPGYWLWPLPPRGPLTIACEWPIVGIPVTAAELDGDALIEAAGGSTALWPPATG